MMPRLIGTLADSLYCIPSCVKNSCHCVHHSEKSPYIKLSFFAFNNNWLQVEESLRTWLLSMDGQNTHYTLWKSQWIFQTVCYHSPWYLYIGIFWTVEISFRITARISCPYNVIRHLMHHDTLCTTPPIWVLYFQSSINPSAIWREFWKFAIWLIEVF